MPTRSSRQRVDAWLAEHHGVISIPEAVRLGVPRRTLYDAVDRGEFVLPLPGVLRSRQWPNGREQLMAAAVARNPAALIAFISGAEEWGFRRLPRQQRVHVLVPHGCSPVMDGVVVHRCRRIDPVDIAVRGDLRLTSPPRTLFDCADMLGPSVTASNLELLIDQHRGTFETHLDCWIRLAHPRRPGTRTMTAVLGSRPVWRRALQSDLESRVLDELTRQELPMPEPQWPMRLPDGRDIVVDFAWPALRVAVEVDHPFWHSMNEHWRRDRSRDRQLMALGWLTPRLTDLDVTHGLARSIADIASILGARSAA
jgi:hypothetical protein